MGLYQRIPSDSPVADDMAAMRTLQRRDVDSTSGQLFNVQETMAAIIAELRRQQEQQEKLLQALQQAQANQQQTLDRIANAGQIAAAEFTDDRVAGQGNWWGGAKPSVSLMSLSGRFRLDYGGSSQLDANVGAFSVISVSLSSGGDRGALDRALYVTNVLSSSRSKVIQLAPGSTLTATLEWINGLRAGWISLQPIL